MILDFSNVLIFARDRGYHGKLNTLNRKLREAVTGDATYNALDHFDLDHELLDTLKEIKSRGKISMHLFTDGNMHTMPEIREQLLPVFDSLNGSAEIGFGKSDPEAFRFLAQRLQLEPNQMLFIDDKAENIEAARLAGLEVIQLISRDQLRDTLKLLGVL
jgi:HAD superfamily hydrolase (TIGR01509 family)